MTGANATYFPSVPARGPFAAPGEALRIETFTDLASCETVWRDFQDVGVATPFQRFDWVSAFLGSHAGAAPETCIVLCRDLSGHPAMLVPLTVERRLGVRVASVVGGRQANYRTPILARDGAAAAASLTAALVQAGARLGIDVYGFGNAPVLWDGCVNPLASGAQASPSDAYSIALGATGEETLAGVIDRQGRKKMRQKEKWLAQLGQVERIEPVGAEAIDAVLEAFFRQKSERLRRLGIHDPFLCAKARAFLREGCGSSAPGSTPPIELHALMLDGQAVAVFAGAVDADRMCGMVISFDARPEIARCSPGDLLLARVIDAQCRHGRKTFDLGAGEARYKRSFCDRVEPLVDILVPVTDSGRLYASAARIAGTAKRLVKRNSWTMRTVQAVRRRTGLLT